MPKREKCPHGNYICEQCVKSSDAAKRFSDGVNGILSFHKIIEISRQWLVIGLQDGSVDSSLFDSREDAIRHQSDESRYFYMPVGNFAQGLSLQDAEIILMFQRDAYDAGLRVTDAQSPDPILPFPAADKYAALLRGGLRWN